jgi:hypothetical protein
MRRFLPLTLCLCLSVFTVACSPEHDGPAAGSSSEASSVDQDSFQIEPTEETVEGQHVLKFTYPTTRAARLVAARISEDGMMLGAKKMPWNGNPHFFRKENIIVLYVGSDQKVIDALKAKFGAQFAGK